MPVDYATLLFFDASCLIAAAGSPSGGSGFLLMLCARGQLLGAVSVPVLLEAERNITVKLNLAAQANYQRLLVDTPLTLLPVPPQPDLLRYEPITGSKDAHVAAAVVLSSAPFLLTLDRRLADRANLARLPFRALAPGDFIKLELPTHPDYRSLRT